MVTKPTGIPAAAKTSAASRVPSSLPSGVTVPSRAEMRRVLARLALAAGHDAGDLDRHARLDRVDDGHRLHVLAGVRQGQVELVQPAALDRPILGAHRRPAEVDLVERVGEAGDGRHVGGGRRPPRAALEVVDLAGAAVGRDERAPGGREVAAGTRAEGEVTGRPRHELARHPGGKRTRSPSTRAPAATTASRARAEGTAMPVVARTSRAAASSRSRSDARQDVQTSEPHVTERAHGSRGHCPDDAAARRAACAPRRLRAGAPACGRATAAPTLRRLALPPAPPASAGSTACVSDATSGRATRSRSSLRILSMVVVVPPPQ